MTKQSAIDKIKCFPNWNLDDEWLKEDEMQELSDMAVEALEKQIPKKIILNSEEDREYEDYICPNCKNILQQRIKGSTRMTIYNYKVCHNCGQALDWH